MAERSIKRNKRRKSNQHGVWRHQRKYIMKRYKQWQREQNDRWQSMKALANGSVWQCNGGHGGRGVGVIMLAAAMAAMASAGTWRCKQKTSGIGASRRHGICWRGHKHVGEKHQRQTINQAWRANGGHETTSGAPANKTAKRGKRRGVAAAASARRSMAWRSNDRDPIRKAKSSGEAKQSRHRRRKYKAPEKPAM